MSERTLIDFSCSDSPAFNDLLTFDELERAFRHLQSTAAGPDSIHNEMFKNLSVRSLNGLLTFYNHIWASREFPAAWAEAVVVPILSRTKMALTHYTTDQSHSPRVSVNSWNAL